MIKWDSSSEKYRQFGEMIKDLQKQVVYYGGGGPTATQRHRVWSDKNEREYFKHLNGSLRTDPELTGLDKRGIVAKAPVVCMISANHGHSIPLQDDSPPGISVNIMGEKNFVKYCDEHFGLCEDTMYSHDKPIPSAL